MRSALETCDGPFLNYFLEFYRLNLTSTICSCSPGNIPLQLQEGCVARKLTNESVLNVEVMLNGYVSRYY